MDFFNVSKKSIPHRHMSVVTVPLKGIAEMPYFMLDPHKMGPANPPATASKTQRRKNFLCLLSRSSELDGAANKNFNALKVSLRKKIIIYFIIKKILIKILQNFFNKIN
jgi:hypothetical protein